MLEVAREHGFTFDTVQMPLNVMDAHYRSFEKLVLPELVQREHRRARDEEHGERHHPASRKTVTPIECLHYALNLPTSVVITGIDSMEILDQAFEAARTFRPMTRGGVQALLAKTGRAAARGEFELFKTSSIFDSTATHPEWLGEEPKHIQSMMPN